MIYFDNAATTQLAVEVINEMQNALSEDFGNSQNNHRLGIKTQVCIEESRRKIAKSLNCNTEDLIFTSNGTEANNLAIFGIIKKYKIENVFTSSLEHDSVLKPLQYLEKENKIKLHFIDFDENFKISLIDLENKLKKTPYSFISLAHTSHLSGNLLPVKKTAEICKRYKSFFHSNFVQSFLCFKHDFSKLKMDLVTISPHKFHGPKGIGILYLKPDIDIENHIFGEKNEYSLRPGTENIYGIVGAAKAIELIKEKSETNYLKCKELKNALINKLNSKNLNFKIFGESSSNQSPNILSIIIEDKKILNKLSEKIQFTNFIADNFLENNQNIVRFSFSGINTIQEIEKIEI